MGLESTPTKDQVIEDWFIKHFHGRGPALDVTIYNICYEAKEDLKRLMADAAPTTKEKA